MRLYFYLCLGLLLCGCEPLPQAPPPKFGILVESPKLENTVVSVKLTFLNVVNEKNANERIVYLQTNQIHDVSNYIIALEAATAELKSIQEQMKIKELAQ